MTKVTFRFYGDLNDFLPPMAQQVDFAYRFQGDQSVKHLIEAIGAPHTEVALMLVDGVSVGFDYLPQSGERVAVYPPFSALELDTESVLRPPLPDPPTFLVDNHLGKLARRLRLLGLDTGYDSALDDDALAERAAAEQRILLTRDRGLLKRRMVVWGYCLRTTDAREQMFAVLRRFRLHDRITPWTRCLHCNGHLSPVAKAAVQDRLEPKTRLYYDDFRQCDSWGRVYWQGSNFQALAALADEAVRSHRTGDSYTPYCVSSPHVPSSDLSPNPANL